MKGIALFFWMVLVTNLGNAQLIITNTGDSIRLSLAVHGSTLSPAYANDTVHVVKYLDTTYGYALPLPDYLEILNTEREDMFVTLFPELNGTRNAFLIESFPLSAYNSLDNFIHEKIDKYNKGDAMNDNPDLILAHKSELQSLDSTKKEFKLQLGYYGDLFVHKWIFQKTKYGYIHYTFNATSTTYPKNVSRFEELMDSIEILE